MKRSIATLVVFVALTVLGLVAALVISLPVR